MCASGESFVFVHLWIKSVLWWCARRRPLSTPPSLHIALMFRKLQRLANCYSFLVFHILLSLFHYNVSIKSGILAPSFHLVSILLMKYFIFRGIFQSGWFRWVFCFLLCSVQKWLSLAFQSHPLISLDKMRCRLQAVGLAATMAFQFLELY